jgi:5-methylcytosine-specific restriction enzyme A
MALSDLTTTSILRALAQFDELGREAFLQRYGFGRARGYFVLHNGNRYDSKAMEQHMASLVPN